LVTISDRKLPVQGNPLTFVGKYLADVVATNDYSAFGAPMVGRGFNSPSYRYGFNGKENDAESVDAGEGLQDYGMRIYNPSLGKFLSVDPLSAFYPWNSTYAFAEGDVIRCVDLDGGERKPSNLASAMHGVYVRNGKLNPALAQQMESSPVSTEFSLQMAAFGIAILHMADGIANAPTEYMQAQDYYSKPHNKQAFIAQVASEGGVVSSMYSLNGALAVGPVKSIYGHLQFGMNANQSDPVSRFDAYTHAYSAAIEAYMLVDGAVVVYETAFIPFKLVGKNTRIWTGGDRLVLDVANTIERSSPYSVLSIEEKIFRETGELATDLDVVTKNVVIEVTAGTGVRKLDQLKKMQEYVGGKEIVIFAPKIGKHAKRGIEKANFKVFTDKSKLIEYVNAQNAKPH
jgi:RHS repeat-associated protein